MTGSATHVAALKLRDAALDAASPLLQTPADDADNHRRTSYSERSSRSGLQSPLARWRPCVEGATGLTAEGWFRTEHMAYPYGVHVAVVKIDRDTGGLRVERYLIAYDVGRAVNPMMVEGQLVGGFAQGLGGAVSEEFVYDAIGRANSRPRLPIISC